MNYKALTALVVVVVAAALLWTLLRPREQSPPANGPAFNGQVTADVHGVEIRRPAGPPRVQTAEKDIHGQMITVSCNSCHATRPPNLQTASGEQLQEFHQGLVMQHGSLTCLSCHNPNDYDALRLADGSRVEYQNVMTLCAQCHGPQYRDYLQGAHGGMTGYWDLSKGPRQRNNCIDCHDAHAPAYGGMMPAPGPRDRFLDLVVPHHEASEREAHE